MRWAVPEPQLDRRRAARELLVAGAIALGLSAPYWIVAAVGYGRELWAQHPWLWAFVPVPIWALVAVYVLVVIRRAGDSIADLGLRFDRLAADVGIGVAVFLFFTGLQAAGTAIAAHASPTFDAVIADSYRALRQFQPFDDPLLFVALFAPGAVLEELLHRGFVLPRLRVLVGGWRPAVLLGSAFFGALHFGQGLDGVASAFVSGLVLAALYLWRGSLVPGIVAHFLANMLTMYAAHHLEGWWR